MKDPGNDDAEEEVEGLEGEVCLGEGTLCYNIIKLNTNRHIIYLHVMQISGEKEIILPVNYE